MSHKLNFVESFELVFCETRDAIPNVIMFVKCSGRLRDAISRQPRAQVWALSHSHWRARAADIVASWQPGSIADLATAMGRFGARSAKKNAHCQGVDFLPEMELARHKRVHSMLYQPMRLPVCRRLVRLLSLLHLACAIWKLLSEILPRAPNSVTCSCSNLIAKHTDSACGVSSLFASLPAYGSCLTQTRSVYECPWQVNRTISQWTSHVRVNAEQSNNRTPPSFKRLTGGIVTIYTAARH